jgi:deoxyribodipyrimidine photolyase
MPLAAPFLTPLYLHALCVCRAQVGSNTPNFNQMAGNPLAKQIPWDTNPTTLAAWKEGNTGVLC